MCSIRLRDVQRILQSIGAYHLRAGKGSHQIWQFGSIIFVVPEHREVSPGVLRDIEKAIQRRGLFRK